MLLLAGAVCLVAIAATCLILVAAKRLLGKMLDKHLFIDANQVHLTAASVGNKQEVPCIRILAFGDDWTEGVTCGGQVFHPYVKRLGDLLHPQMGVHLLEIEEQGNAGDTVLADMRERLQLALDKHAAAGRPYDYVLLQGGINDLLAQKPAAASEVMAGLDLLVQSCLAHGANVMLMTLLEVAESEPEVEAQRQALNAAIREYVAKKQWQKAPIAAATHGTAVAEIRLRPAAATSSKAAAMADGDGKPLMPVAVTTADASGKTLAHPEVFLCDVASYLPYSTLSEQEKWELWHNDQQLTVDGYDALGLLLSNSLGHRIKRQLRALQA